jgi:hypothetical protein
LCVTEAKLPEQLFPQCRTLQGAYPALLLLAACKLLLPERSEQGKEEALPLRVPWVEEIQTSGPCGDGLALHLVSK